MKNIPLIIHIPHSSLRIPRIFKNKCLLNVKDLYYENMFMSDLYVDRFVSSFKYSIIKFNYSRLFCDVEKFKDDEKEIMSKVGMGCVYTKTSDGKKLIQFDNEYRNWVIDNYYDVHHENIDLLLEKKLEKFNKCFIFDLHSFSSKQVKKTLKYDEVPDICVGIDDNFNDEKIQNMTCEYFEKLGYKVSLNYPYAGTFVPNKAYNSNDKRVKSIMIELNKDLYVNEDFSINNINFKKLKNDVNNYLKELEKLI